MFTSCIYFSCFGSNAYYNYIYIVFLRLYIISIWWYGAYMFCNHVIIVFIWYTLISHYNFFALSRCCFPELIICCLATEMLTLKKLINYGNFPDPAAVLLLFYRGSFQARRISLYFLFACFPQEERRVAVHRIYIGFLPVLFLQ